MSSSPYCGSKVGITLTYMVMWPLSRTWVGCLPDTWRPKTHHYRFRISATASPIRLHTNTPLIALARTPFPTRVISLLSNSCPSLQIRDVSLITIESYLHRCSFPCITGHPLACIRLQINSYSRIIPCSRNSLGRSMVGGDSRAVINTAAWCYDKRFQARS